MLKRKRRMVAWQPLRGSNMSEEQQGQNYWEWPLIGMTIDETAAALRVNPKTVRDMIKARPDFPARRMGAKGRDWRIDPDALRRWLDGRDEDRD